MRVENAQQNAMPQRIFGISFIVAHARVRAAFIV